jgi:glycolate oxidase FAD binding subunit
VSAERITVENEAAAADAVRACAARGSSLEIVSGASKRKFGRPVRADAIVDTSPIAGIMSYEPDELIITLRAATTLTEVTAVLSEKRQMLAFSPVNWGPIFGEAAGRATLAGIVATNGAGSRRFKAGGVRDHLIGCRFVNGSGEIIRAGGRVVKNVTGFDIPKLMCGAFGTLGVLTELTFRVVPAPERAPSLAVVCREEEGLRILRRAAALQIEPTGLAYLNEKALIRVEGSAPTVTEKLAVLQKVFAEYQLSVLDDAATLELFREIGNGGCLMREKTDVWRLVVPPAAAYEALTASSAASWYADWAGGLLWLGLPGDAATAAQLRGITRRVGGHAVLMRSSEAARAELEVFEPENEAHSAITCSVKAAFDPGGVLNPGRMYRDI